MGRLNHSLLLHFFQNLTNFLFVVNGQLVRGLLGEIMVSSVNVYDIDSQYFAADRSTLT